MTTKTDTPLILIARPHQMPARVGIYRSRDDLIKSWVDEEVLECRFYDADQFDDTDLTFENAIYDLGHDLYGLDILQSAEEYLAWANEGGHNKPYSLAHQAAVELGWAEEEE